MNNKHFRITISHGHSTFDRDCETMYEAYDSVCDAVLLTGINVDMDEIIEILYNMKNENTLCHEYNHLRISVIDGEL